MDLRILDATPPVNTTSDAYSPNFGPLLIVLIIWLIMNIIHDICSWSTPFHISAIRADQDKTTKLLEQQIKLEQQKLQIEKQRLQFEVEKLNLERAKLNLPLYVPISVATEQPGTTSAENNKPAV